MSMNWVLTQLFTAIYAQIEQVSILSNWSFQLSKVLNIFEYVELGNELNTQLFLYIEYANPNFSNGNVIGV